MYAPVFKVALPFARAVKPILDSHVANWTNRRKLTYEVILLKEASDKDCRPTSAKLASLFWSVVALCWGHSRKSASYDAVFDMRNLNHGFQNSVR
jgi:hypothetical protein